MEIIIQLVWFDKVTDELVGQKTVTHLFSKEELRMLFDEKRNLDGNYLLKTETQRKFIEKRLCIKLSQDYDYFIRFCGDWTLDLRDAIWIPAPTSTYTDKKPIDRLEAEKAFLSEDPEKILDALIRITFFDPNPFYIQEKCLECLKSKNIDIQREAIICIGHLARIHGKVDVKKVVPLLKNLANHPKLAESVEESLDDIEAFLHVKRQTDNDEQTD